MIAWLYQFPSIVIIITPVFMALLVCAAGPWIAHHVFRMKPDEERSAAAIDGFKLVGPLTGVFTAFLLLQSITKLNDARHLVESQAMNLLQLDHSIGQVSNPEAYQARQAVRNYARSLVDYGWPAMRAMKPSADVETALNKLSNEVDSVAKSAPENHRLLQSMSVDLGSVGDVQAQISAAALGGLPQAFWLVQSVLLMLMAAQLAMVGPKWSQIAPLAGYSAALGLLIGLLFAMDRPFLGDESADPTPIERAIMQLDLYAHLTAPPLQSVGLPPTR